ncbi:glycosyltransferase 29 protein [Cymbomonas tetramitiformis]|uniref:Glycosyltransferase 29 protein n=1 Tax=Cymbomonas tetramitiformis TaxID=36881 RepID=A0AAE0KQL8_9CHLO|nr:glycosyltransferase 29 protein [Cymbomonas tetramitiformis]
MYLFSADATIMGVRAHSSSQGVRAVERGQVYGRWSAGKCTGGGALGQMCGRWSAEQVYGRWSAGKCTGGGARVIWYRFVDDGSPGKGSSRDRAHSDFVELTMIGDLPYLDYYAKDYRGKSVLARYLFPSILPELLPRDDVRGMWDSYPTCAVVGNAGTLLEKELGEEIDRHAAVFRAGFPPVAGFERHVGRHTTYDVVDMDRVKLIVNPVHHRYVVPEHQHYYRMNADGTQSTLLLTDSVRCVPRSPVPCCCALLRPLVCLSRACSGNPDTAGGETSRADCGEVVGALLNALSRQCPLSPKLLQGQCTPSPKPL